MDQYQNQIFDIAWSKVFSATGSPEDRYVLTQAIRLLPQHPDFHPTIAKANLYLIFDILLVARADFVQSYNTDEGYSSDSE